jgi:hypothetical protein
MKFDPLPLENLLKATGLPYRSLPFIHGAITVQAISPLYEDDTDTRGNLCSLLFDVATSAIPPSGLNDPKISAALECVAKTATDIACDLENEEFDPYFGDHSDTATSLDIAMEWCNGFVAAAALNGDWWIKDDIREELADPFATLQLCADHITNPIPDDIRADVDELWDDPDLCVAECVCDINDFWRTWEDDNCD